MTGMILDGVLMLLLVAALGYGVRLERKLTALREGQQAFASAVTDLNAAAGRAENALASRRASGQETDLLHDRNIQGMAIPAKPRAAGESNVAAILGAIAANQSAKQSLNRARRSLDEDLFAA